MALLARFLRGLGVEEIGPSVLMITGSVFPSSDKRVLNISDTILSRVLARLGKEPSDPALTILDVYRAFCRLASLAGDGVVEKREKVLEELFRKATAMEREWLVRIILGEMRHGVGEGTMLLAIGEAGRVEPEAMERAYMLCGDLGRLAMVAMMEGREGLKSMALTPFTPVRPMLAEMSYDVGEVLKEHGGRSAFEYKFDGARVQIHMTHGRVAVFSSHLKDVTEGLPDVVEIVRKGIRADEAVLDGEVVAVGREGRPLPFQELMRRFNRLHHIDRLRKEVPVKLYLFDILYLNGRPLIDIPYTERRATLEEICEEEVLAANLVTSRREEVESLLARSLSLGHEGLMAKALDSLYTPGVRGKRWFKIKPAETLDVVIVAAEWGHGRREGWLSNYHLAVRDKVTGGYLVVGKTFKGLTDEGFRDMTERLIAFKIREEGFTVYVRPAVVVEVAYNEIQWSPRYPSGLALRFARIRRIRDDKGPEEVDTIQRLRTLYKDQFKRKAMREVL